MKRTMKEKGASSMSMQTGLRRWAFGFAAGLTVAMISSPVAIAQPNSSLAATDVVEFVEFNASGEPFVGEVAISAGKSMLLRFNRPVSEALVGDGDTADIIALTETSIYLLGKDVGATNLTLLGPDKQMLGVLDVQITHDILNLKKRLHEMLPGRNLEVRTNGGALLLSGLVSDVSDAQRAVDIADNYAPGNVVNMIDVAASQQVMLAVRFAEVERTAAKALGISTDVLFNGAGGDSAGLISTFDPLTALSSSNFAALGGTFQAGEFTIDLLLDTLEERGVASILAEPTLIARSGESASFLAGGEFPVPVGVNQGSGIGNTIEIEFKEFGVRLGFTPTVIGETISVTVTPEVSELDPENGIELSGFSIPALTTRRASTTVELKNGQSFAIAGLLQKSFLDELDQFPGASSLPILGSLLRSARYERDETELTIIITPYLVQPSAADNPLTLPTDYFERPHELELFFLGQVESSGRLVENSLVQTPSSVRIAQQGQDPVGYIID